MNPLPDPSQITVSIVDDHQIVRDGIKALLKSDQSIQIWDEASDGQSALAMLRNRVPSVLILDIALPDISGIDLAKRVREAFPGVQILMLSMYSDEDFVLNSIRAGASGYLPKNTDRKTLLEALRCLHEGGSFFDPSISATLVMGLVKKTRDPLSESQTLLTKREIEILSCCTEGLSNKEIADRLFISVRTVESHKNHMMQKLGLKSPVELIKFALRNNLGKL